MSLFWSNSNYPRPKRRYLGWILILGILFTAPAAAGPREQARRMHDRLVGVPPAAGVLDSMETAISGGDAIGAAYMAMTNPLFYTAALKNFVTPWTNEAQTAFDDLNDYTATVIGLIRDERNFKEVLTADVVYVAAQGLTNDGYSHTDNRHYEQIEGQNLDLSNPAVLVPVTQSGLPDSQLMAQETAGVITTRAAGRAFFSAGTNRRMWRFIGMNYMCHDMEGMNDITRPSHRLRQDVSRSPGGDSRIFHNTCVGCHAGMDALSGAFAYYEWDQEAERVVYTRNQVQPKFLINAPSFTGGFITTDDSWENLWRFGSNANFGWRGPNASGNGVKSLGEEVAESRAFSTCQVAKVFERVCLHPPQTPADYAEVERIADVFEGQNYSMKRVFAETATYCMGQ